MPAIRPPGIPVAKKETSRTVSGIEYTRIGEIRGPLMVIQGVSRVAYDELVEIETAAGERRLGRVLEVGEEQ